MYKDFPRIVEAARLKLEAWGLKPGESIALLASSETLPVLREAYFTAAIALDAEPVLVMYEGRPNYSGLPDFVVSMLTDVDVVGNLHGVTWSYSKSLARLVKLRMDRETASGRTDHHGAIPLHVFGGDESELLTLLNCPPDAEVKERVLKARPLIDNAKTIRITSSLGTDLVMDRGTRPSFAPWMGQVNFWPPPKSASGRIMFVGAVRSCAPTVLTKMIHLPVEMRVEEGRIVEISRATANGVMLDDWFRAVGDPSIYQLAHVNLGLDPRIVIHNLDNFALHFNYGGVLTGFGAKQVGDAGGTDPGISKITENLPGHVEMHQLGVDYWVDDECILQNGEFTEESGLRAKSR
jgi:hypothetical protein